MMAYLLSFDTKNIAADEVSELINYDQKHLQLAMKAEGLSDDELAPSLRPEEILQAQDRKDVLKWIFFENKLVGYFWFEIKKDCLYINAIAIERDFQGKGLAQHVLTLADDIASELSLNCRLSVSPMNGKALNVYFKLGYKIVSAVNEMFGHEYPKTFRVIMEKINFVKNNLSQIVDEVDIFCNDYNAIKRTTDAGYVGVRLIVSEDRKNEKNMIHFER